MPVYSIRNNQNNEESEVNMKYSDFTEYLHDNPHIQQIFTRFPATGDPVRLGISRVDDNFRDVLKKAKVHKHNTINDF